MNLIPDKMGGNRKQEMWLVGLTVVLVVVCVESARAFVSHGNGDPTRNPRLRLPAKVRWCRNRRSGPKMPTRSGRQGRMISVLR